MFEFFALAGTYMHKKNHAADEILPPQQSKANNRKLEDYLRE